MFNFTPKTADWLRLHYGVHCDADGDVCNMVKSEIVAVVKEALEYLDFVEEAGLWMPEYTPIAAELRAKV